MNFATIRIFRQNPSQLYHIVSNVDSYHEFVPFIINSKVTSFDTIIKRLNGYKMTRLRGSLTVGMPATAFISPFSYDSVVSLEERIKGLELYRVKVCQAP